MVAARYPQRKGYENDIGQGGYGYIEKGLSGFNEAAAIHRFIVLIDADDRPCPPQAIAQWLKNTQKVLTRPERQSAVRDPSDPCTASGALLPFRVGSSARNFRESPTIILAEHQRRCRADGRRQCLASAGR